MEPLRESVLAYMMRERMVGCVTRGNQSTTYSGLRDASYRWHMMMTIVSILHRKKKTKEEEKGHRRIGVSPKDIEKNPHRALVRPKPSDVVMRHDRNF